MAEGVLSFLVRQSRSTEHQYGDECTLGAQRFA
jgi:hypothetical protein